MRKKYVLILVFILLFTLACIGVGWAIGQYQPSKITSVACTDPINIAREVKYSAVLTNDGIVKLEKSGLMRYKEDESQCLVEDAAAFCWDGSHILYLDENSGSVYAFDSQTPSELFTIDSEADSNSCFMLASNKWIVLRGWESLHIYHRETDDLRSLSSQSNINDSDAFIIEDKLICVGGEKELFAIMDLTTGAIDTIDVGIDTTQRPTTASCVYDGSKAYLSVRIRSWPGFGIKYDDGTYAIDLTNLQIEKLSDKYYETLYFKDNYLYGE